MSAMQFLRRLQTLFPQLQVRRRPRIKLDLVITHPNREQEREADGECGDNDGRLNACNRGCPQKRRAKGYRRRGDGNSENRERSGSGINYRVCCAKLGSQLSQNKNFSVAAFPRGSEFFSCADNAHKVSEQPEFFDEFHPESLCQGK